MSPENYGVFQVLKEVTFQKNSGILQLEKMWLFWINLYAVQCDPDGLMGPVREIFGRKRTNRDTNGGNFLASLVVRSWKGFEIL